MNHQIGNPIDDRPEGLLRGLFVHSTIAAAERKPNKSTTFDATIARVWKHFPAKSAFAKLRNMKNTSSHRGRKARKSASRIPPGHLPASTSQEFIFPQPDAIGIANMQKLYLDKFNKVLSDGDAREILSRLMRYIYLLNFPCSITESTLENRTTTGQ